MDHTEFYKIISNELSISEQEARLRYENIADDFEGALKSISHSVDFEMLRSDDHLEVAINQISQLIEILYSERPSCEVVAAIWSWHDEYKKKIMGSKH